jgi:hypothetical protein
VHCLSVLSFSRVTCAHNVNIPQQESGNLGGVNSFKLLLRLREAAGLTDSCAAPDRAHVCPMHTTSQVYVSS